MRVEAPMLVFLVAMVTHAGHGYRDEVDVFFQSNTEEMQDQLLTFDKPPPSWLKGTLIRNGFGRFEVGKRSFRNALDAYGKLASWRFPGNGSALFTTRMIYTDSYNDALRLNDIAPYLLLDKTTPVFDVEEDLECLKNGPDNTNVNIFNFGGNKSDFVVVSDYWKVYSVDPYTLKTLTSHNPPIPDSPYSEYPISLSSAHPLPEFGTSNYLTFVSVASFIPGIKSKLMIARATSASGREIITTIEVNKASYMHSFAVTEHYVVLFAVPFYVNPMGILKHFMPLDAFEWDSDAVTALYVIDIKTGTYRTLKTENMFFLHIANAYESDLFDNQIIIDVCAFRNTSGMLDFEFTRLHNPADRSESTAATLKRYTLDLNSNEVSVHEFSVTSDVPFVNHLDFPTINENYRSKKHCYIYGVVPNYDRKDFLHMAAVKKDVCSGKNEYAWIETGRLVNEAYFIPRPGGTEEDDGILIAPVLDAFSNSTNITIFDAKNLSVLSSAKLPIFVPFGTHGHFFDYLI